MSLIYNSDYENRVDRRRRRRLSVWSWSVFCCSTHKSWVKIPRTRRRKQQNNNLNNKFIYFFVESVAVSRRRVVVDFFFSYKLLCRRAQRSGEYLELTQFKSSTISSSSRLILGTYEHISHSLCEQRWIKFLFTAARVIHIQFLSLCVIAAVLPSYFTSPLSPKPQTALRAESERESVNLFARWLRTANRKRRPSTFFLLLPIQISKELNIYLVTWNRIECNWLRIKIATAKKRKVQHTSNVQCSSWQERTFQESRYEIFHILLSPESRRRRRLCWGSKRHKPQPGQWRER